MIIKKKFYVKSIFFKTYCVCWSDISRDEYIWLDFGVFFKCCLVSCKNIFSY